MRVREITPPANARGLSTLACVDYADAFVGTPGETQERTAVEWARSIIEGAPLAVRSALVTGWSSLGLRLAPPWSEEHVLGWEVRRSTPDVALLAAGSRLGDLRPAARQAPAPDAALPAPDAALLHLRPARQPGRPRGVEPDRPRAQAGRDAGPRAGYRPGYSVRTSRLPSLSVPATWG